MERRKAATRQALLDAARRMLADGTATSASIQDVTSAADVGFGSLYNHFDDKSQLFEAAVEQVLEEWADYLDRAAAEADDPALVFITGFRRSVRFLLARPVEAGVVLQYTFRFLEYPNGLGPHARRDIKAAVEAGRLSIDPNGVDLAVAKTAGFMFALLHRGLQDEGSVGDEQIDTAACELLRIFGLKPAEARKLSQIALGPVPEA